MVVMNDHQDDEVIYQYPSPSTSNAEQAPPGDFRKVLAPMPRRVVQAVSFSRPHIQAHGPEKIHTI